MSLNCTLCTDMLYRSCMHACALCTLRCYAQHCSNVAGAVAFSIGTAFTGIWDVGNATIAKQDFSGMWKLTLLTRSVMHSAKCMHTTTAVAVVS
jgi:hypothetical protein